MKILKMKKFYLYLGGLLILFVSYFVFFFKFKKRTGDNPSDFQVTQDAVDRLTSDHAQNESNAKKYVKLARQLAHDLGTAYEWYDPRRWSENDQDVFNLMKGLTTSEREYIINAYSFVTSGRDLINDIYSLLDSKYLDQLNF